MYKEINKAAFEKIVIEEKRPSVLVFSAKWSGNSELMDSMMERVSGEFEEELNFLKIDIEDQIEVSQFFGVASVPTIIMLKDGEIVEFLKGLMSATKIRKKIKEIFVA